MLAIVWFYRAFHNLRRAEAGRVTLDNDVARPVRRRVWRDAVQGDAVRAGCHIRGGHGVRRGVAQDKRRLFRTPGLAYRRHSHSQRAVRAAFLHLRRDVKGRLRPGRCVDRLPIGAQRHGIRCGVFRRLPGNAGRSAGIAFVKRQHWRGRRRDSRVALPDGPGALQRVGSGAHPRMNFPRRGRDRHLCDVRPPHALPVLSVRGNFHLIPRSARHVQPHQHNRLRVPHHAPQIGRRAQAFHCRKLAAPLPRRRGQIPILVDARVVIQQFEGVVQQVLRADAVHHHQPLIDTRRVQGPGCRQTINAGIDPFKRVLLPLHEQRAVIRPIQNRRSPIQLRHPAWPPDGAVRPRQRQIQGPAFLAAFQRRARHVLFQAKAQPLFVPLFHRAGGCVFEARMRHSADVAPVDDPPQRFHLTLHRHPLPTVVRGVGHRHLVRMAPIGNAQNVQTGRFQTFRLRQGGGHVPLLKAVIRVQIIHGHIVRRVVAPSDVVDAEAVAHDIARGQGKGGWPIRRILHKGKDRPHKARHYTLALTHLRKEPPDQIRPVQVTVIMPLSGLQGFINGPQRIKIDAGVRQPAAPLALAHMRHRRRPGPGRNFFAPAPCLPVVERELARHNGRKLARGRLRQRIVRLDAEGDARNGVGERSRQHGSHGPPGKGVQRSAVALGVGRAPHPALIPPLGHGICFGHALRRERRPAVGNAVQHGPFGKRRSKIVDPLILNDPRDAVMLQIPFIIVPADAL